MKTLTMVFVTFILLLCFSNHTFSQINFATQLTASQSVPPVAVETSATGTGYFILNEEKTELQFRITVCDLTGPITAAHFHNDRFGKAGGVVRTITNDFNGNTATGIWKSTDGESLTPQLVQALLEGEIYVNIHTAANQPGEIRGQLGSLGFTANLDTAQAIPSPAMPSGASGSGTFTLNPGKSELKFDITVDNLTGPITAAHFHLGEAGTTGSVVKTITGDFVGNTASGYWRSSDSEALTDSLVDELMSDNLYINIHTAANQPGEIRGQVLLDNDIHLSTQLTVNQAVPPVGVTSEGSGTGAFTLDDTMIEVKYSITVTNLTGPVTAAHFHRGAPGSAGGVAKTITGDFVGNTAIGKWESTDSEPLTPELVDELLKGNLYINIHTSSNQPGEIRGQIGEQMFFAALDTAQSIPPPAMASSASGTGVVRLNPAMNAAKFDLTVCDLTGPLAAAHFHNGAAGATGGVVRTITNDFDGNTATGVWLTTDMEPLNEQMVSELQAGNLYFNIHTAANQPGEIRGQVNPASLITSVERLPGLTNIPREFDLFQNFPNPFNPATEIRFNLRQASRTILRIFNMVGQEVATPLDAHLEAGAYKVTFDAKRLPSGVYMYRLESLGLVEVRKMILLK